MTRKWTDEELAALLDGELDPDTERAMRAALEADPEARRRAQEIARTGDLLRAAFDAPMREPAPATLEAAILGRPGRVAVLPRRRPRVWIPAAAAASVALAAGLWGGLVLDGDGDSGGVVAPGDAPRGGALHAALETAPSGTRSAGGIRPMLSFRDRTGRACREFEIDEAASGALRLGIACRQAGGTWHVEVVAAGPGAPDLGDGYVPASGPADDVMDAALDALGGGTPLSPEQERALLESGWTPGG